MSGRVVSSCVVAVGGGGVSIKQKIFDAGGGGGVQGEVAVLAGTTLPCYCNISQHYLSPSLPAAGYPRPVQFFVNPAAGAAAGPSAAAAAAAGGAGMAAATAGAAQGQAPAEAEFYLINGRPKRRRVGSTGSLLAASAGLAAAAGAEGEGGGAAGAADAPVNFQAAGSRVFVMRRKLLKVGAELASC